MGIQRVGGKLRMKETPLENVESRPFPVKTTRHMNLLFIYLHAFFKDY